MTYLEQIDYQRADFGSFYDELPLWSAPFGLAMLERVPIQAGIRVLDVGAGTGFLSIELAQRCGVDATIFAVDPWAAAATRLREKLDYVGLTNVHVIESHAAEIDLPGASIVMRSWATSAPWITVRTSKQCCGSPSTSGRRWLTGIRGRSGGSWGATPPRKCDDWTAIRESPSPAPSTTSGGI